MPESNALPLETVHLVRDTCLCLAAQRAARRLARRFDRAFQPMGITNQQFSLMMTLSAPTPMPIGRLAAFLAMDRTTVTAALKALERRGLVATAPDARDRRARRAALTETGRARLREATVIWRQEHAALDDELGAARAARLRADLGALEPGPAAAPAAIPRPATAGGQQGEKR